jgi:hypothetical protein
MTAAARRVKARGLSLDQAVDLDRERHGIVGEIVSVSPRAETEFGSIARALRLYPSV